LALKRRPVDNRLDQQS